MDIQDKIQFWKNEVERAEQNGFYFDTQSMREVIVTVEEQQKEISDWKNIVKIHNENGKFLTEKVERYERALESNKVCQKCNSEIRKALEETTGDKVLIWSNGVEWGEIEHPELGMVMTYWRAGTPCYDTYTVPMVNQDGHIYCHRFCQDDGVWKDTIWIGEYEGEEEIAFG